MIIIDNFIQDESLLNDIVNDQDFFNHRGTYMWWDGWWSDSPVDTLKKRLINYIWNENCPLIDANYEIEGFEYWTGKHTPGDGLVEVGFDNVSYHLRHHFDKDEALWHESGKTTIVCPIIGTVFYPDPQVDDIEGGELIMWDTQEVRVDVPYEIIRPKFNRLVIFDAFKLHAVYEVTKGVRSAIAINLWAQRPSGLKTGELVDERSYLS
jgi:hypothetical protein